MKPSSPLVILRERAEAALENATRKLGEVQRQHQHAGEQLEALLTWQQEYRHSLNNSMQSGITGQRRENYIQFIQSLELAIEQQRQQLMRWSEKVAQALNDWRDHQQRLLTWQTLESRKASEAQYQAQRQEQKQMDEYARRASRGKTS
ncbi:flagellar export protein FliJ [Entomohabitans teleogrylli]|uniref:flagellar export protein FliJ n=1 Tax=Entomohabitans teleogrylli TaxID=1384589 RepID=UPI00073D648B|nr:flagellar export protein FliJ [Entomohabitans teleogrylli]